MKKLFEEIIDLDQAPGVDVVVQLYFWFKFYFPLF